METFNKPKRTGIKPLGKPNMWKSILFAFIGMALGVGIYVLLYHVNIISAYAILLMYLFGHLGYNLGGGKQKHAMPVIIVLGIIASFLAYYLGLYITLAKVASTLPTLTGLELSFFNVFAQFSALMGDNATLATGFKSDTIWFAVFAVVTLILYIVCQIITLKKAKKQALTQGEATQQAQIIDVQVEESAKEENKK